jgi:sulfur relay (sulfurtransferase) complex TusBCD TusD component (DsrE family)
MAKTLLILNDPPYGTERSYNALRLAGYSQSVTAKR